MLTYGFEKISMALLGLGPNELGVWGIEDVVEQAILDFREALNRRGLGIGALDVVDYVIDQLKYPVEQLKLYLSGAQNDIPNVTTAKIFNEYVHAKMAELKHHAEEIDESYVENNT